MALTKKVRDALDVHAQKIANQITELSPLRHQALLGGSPLLEDAVRQALDGPAKKIADQIAASSSFRLEALLGRSPLFEDAVRQALDGPAKEIADEIARSTSFRYEALLGGREVLGNAVRDELSGRAGEIAEQISKSSLGWLRHYSGQTLEPALFYEIAEVLAGEQLDSPQSDYRPAVIDRTEERGGFSPAEIFERYEIVVKSFQGLTSELDRLTRRLGPLTIAWRGQSDAKWGLHSTLYRELRGGDNLTPLSRSIPTEDEMVTAERYLLSEIGNRWRLGNSPGVELLARMQHRGVPTRLLDATRNPLLALWFAVSANPDADARLFAVAHRPIPRGDDPRTKTLEEAMWSDRRPFWFDLHSPAGRVIGAWGTGTRLREIVPPDYDKRILAQNAVFLLDGVPSLPESVLEEYNRVSGGEWTAADVATSMSVVLAVGDPSRKRMEDSTPFSHVYSFRIPRKLKQRIADTLRRTYGLDWEIIYPDIDGVRNYLDVLPGWSRTP